MNHSKLTQMQTLKNHLLAGKSITTWEAIELYKITYLTTRISNLRRKGLIISQKSITDYSGKRYNVYWLDSAYIEAYKLKGGTR